MAQQGNGHNRVRLIGAENEERREQQERHGMRPESRRVLILGLVFLLVFVASVILPTYITQARYHSLPTWLEDMSYNLNGFIGFFVGNGVDIEYKFSAVIVGAIGGCALGLCGSTYQGAFNNPLAAPKTLGVMAGGALGTLLWLLLARDTLVPEFPQSQNDASTLSATIQLSDWLMQNDPMGWLLSSYGSAICSVIGCFVTVGIVLGIVSVVGRGRLSNIIVIICGSVVAGAVTGIIEFARYVFSTEGGDEMAQEIAEIENYVLFNSYTYSMLPYIVIPILVCIVIVLLMRNRLALLSFGDDEARSMGIDVNKSRYLMIIICTFMTGWAISFCGHIAFLGFISAHLARKIVGPDFRFLLPASVFTGGTLVLIVLYISQSGLPYTSPGSAGTICSVLGGLLFLVVAFQEGRRALAKGE